jgi:hypothetical protein
VTIRGSRLTLDTEPGHYVLRLDPAQRTFQTFLPESNEREFFGFKVQVPSWLMRPQRCAFGNYELDNDRLMLHMRGELDTATGETTESPDGRKVYLAR